MDIIPLYILFLSWENSLIAVNIENIYTKVNLLGLVSLLDDVTSKGSAPNKEKTKTKKNKKICI